MDFEQLELFAELEIEEAWVDEEIELLSSDEYHRAYIRLRKMEGDLIPRSTIMIKKGICLLEPL